MTVEFPHLLRLVREAQFDTVYHEHFSYLSLHTVERIPSGSWNAIQAFATTLSFDAKSRPARGGAC